MTRGKIPGSRASRPRTITSAVLAAVLVGVACSARGQSTASAQTPFEMVGASFAAILTPDVEAAAEWYGATLALEVVLRIDAEDGRYAIRILARSGFTLELIEAQDASSPPQRHLGLFKVGFHVDDISATHAWLREHGADADERIFLDEALGARTFVFRDPDGNRLQVFQTCGEACP